ncbi:MAG: proton-conducting transporter membrane subunit [Bacteroidota bacterium]
MILALLIFLPLAFMIFAFMFRHYRGREYIALAFAGFNLILAFFLLGKVHVHDMLKVQMGNWPAPYGITLVADRFSAIMIAVASIVFVASMAYSIQALETRRKSFGFYLFSFGVIMGVNGSLMAGDVFNLYIWFEVMLMASFILMGHGGEKKQIEGSIKYLILNLISSFFFLAGIGLLYGKLGTLNMADLALKLSNHTDQLSSINPAFILIFVSFAIKGALVPFFFWLPASYHTPPPVVTALFAGLLTKVGIYSMIRFYTLYWYHDELFWQPLILWTAGLSMVIGVIAATSQFEFRKVLSFHIISQMGYVIMGLGFFTVAGLAGAVFFLLHNMIAKTNVFLIAGFVHKEQGKLNLKTLGDFYKKHPYWTALFFISAFSLAGLPLLSGFVGKYLLISAGIQAGQINMALIALFVGLFTLFSMVKIWVEVFWKSPPSECHPTRPPTHLKRGNYWMTGATTAMAVLIVAGGIWAGPLVDFCTQAAESLLTPARYIDFVLHGPYPEANF